MSRFCFEQLKKLKCEHQLDTLCIISEPEYIDICKEFGLDWYMHENLPLGKKINAGLRRSLVYDFDYVMMMNSDSVIKSELFDYYKPFFESLNPYFGIDRVTYVNFGTNEAVEARYDYSVLGIAKCIHRSLIERSFNELGEVYRAKLNRCLDDTMMDNMIRMKVFPAMVQYDGMLAMDFKSEVNIHPWEKFKDRKKVCYSPL